MLPLLPRVIAAILVPALLLRFAGRVLIAGDEAIIVDGWLHLPRSSSALWWLPEVPLVFGWCWAVTAGTAVVGAARRGVPMRAGAALRTGLRRVPLTLHLLVISVVGFVAGAGVVGFAASAGPWAALAVGLPVALAGTALLARLAVALPAAVLDGRRGGSAVSHAFAITRGGVIRTTTTVVLGVLGVPLVLGRLVGSVGSAADGSSASGASASGSSASDLLGGGFGAAMVLAVVSAAAAVAAVAVQSATLAHAYPRSRPDTSAGTDAAESGTDARESGADAPESGADAPGSGPGRRPTGSTGDRVRRRRMRALTGALALTAAVTLPATGAAAVTLINPYGVASAHARHSTPVGLVLATAWPAGRPPLVVTEFGIYDCRDARCTAVTQTSLRGWYSAAAVGTDGAVVAGSVLRPDGRDRLDFGVCDRHRACRAGSVPLFSGGGDPQPDVALALAPDGTVVIASARDLPRVDGAAGRVEVAVTRCADVACERPRTTVLGRVDSSLSARADRRGIASRAAAVPRERLSVRLDPTGTPVVGFREPVGGRAWIGSCVDPDCAGGRLDPRVTRSEASAPFAVTDRSTLLSLTGGVLYDCGEADCATTDVARDQVPGEGALRVSGDGIYGAVAESTTRAGLALHVGEPPPELRRAVLWHCPDVACRDRRQVRLPAVEAPISQTEIAVGPGGQVLLVQTGGGRTTMVTVRLG